MNSSLHPLLNTHPYPQHPNSVHESHKSFPNSTSFIYSPQVTSPFSPLVEHESPLLLDHQEADKPSPKRRRRLNATETKLLQEVFLYNQKPNAQLRAELGRKLGMTPRAVQIW